MLVNGIAYSWADAVFTVAGIVVNGIDGIKYTTKQDKVNNYGAGSKPVSRSYGKEEYEGEITLHMEEIEALTNAAPNRDITKLAMFDVTVTFAPVLGKEPIRHMLRGCEFLENSRDMKEGDQKFSVTLPLIIGDIEW